MPVNSGQGPSLHLSFVGRVDLYGPARLRSWRAGEGIKTTVTGNDHPRS